MASTRSSVQRPRNLRQTCRNCTTHHKALRFPPADLPRFSARPAFWVRTYFWDRAVELNLKQIFPPLVAFADFARFLKASSLLERIYLTDSIVQLSIFPRTLSAKIVILLIRELLIARILITPTTDEMHAEYILSDCNFNFARRNGKRASSHHRFVYRELFVRFGWEGKRSVIRSCSDFPWRFGFLQCNHVLLRAFKLPLEFRVFFCIFHLHIILMRILAFPSALSTIVTTGIITVVCVILH